MGMQRRYGDGRKGSSTWMAGGGVKGGHRYGATDEHGIAAVKDSMHINDLHATVLYLPLQRPGFPADGPGGVVAKRVFA
jgi:hypothetical protein